MEDVCILSNRMKKVFRNMKNKSTKFLSKNKKTSGNNLSDQNSSVHAQEESCSQQSLVVQQETCHSETQLCVANEERLEVSVVNSVPLKSCNVESRDVIPNIQIEDQSGCTVVALRNNNSDTSSVDNTETAANVNTMLCLNEQPPSELVELDDVSTEQLGVIRNEALQEANREHPIKCYDFCLICCEDDYDIAENIKDTLCSSFNLVGCMIENDTFMLGRDIFQAYEMMMDKSTKVMFLITDAFNCNPFNQRLQNGAVFQTLMSRVKKEKCVPIFPNGLCEVPLPLSGISGISCKLPPQVLNARINATYTEEVRNIRVMREQVLLEIRDRFYNELLWRKAEEYKAKSLQQQQSRTLGTTSMGGGNRAITSGTSEPTYAGNQQGSEAVSGLASILGSAGLTDDQKSNVSNIVSQATNLGQRSILVSGSEHVQVGSNINIVMNFPQLGVPDMTVTPESERQVSSDSSQDSSSDSDSDAD